MREGIYDLTIAHARQQPVKQAFEIRGYSLCIDLLRFDRDVPSSALLGFDKVRLHNFRRKDFSVIADKTLSARDTALQFLKKETGMDADQVFLLANPAILGYAFNPVSFFFCLQKDRHVATIVEVNNTFGGQKHFILPADSDTGVQRKDFYVSPFISPHLDFALRIPLPDETLSIGIHTKREAATVLVAEMRGRLFPLSDYRLFRFFCKYPFHTLRVIVLIHWYALKLFAKKVPFYPKANADAAIIHAELRRES